MSFPDEDLEVTVRAAFGADLTAAPETWAFTDLSDRLIADNPITISRGVVVGQGTKRTSACTITLLNDDGWLTPELMTSPWWPNVDQGTPIDLALRTRTTPTIAHTFTTTTGIGFGTADTGQTWTTSNGTLVTGGKGQITHSAANQIRIPRLPQQHRDVEVTCDVALATVATGAPVLIGPALRCDSTGQNHIYCAFEFNTGGASQWTVRHVVGNVYGATIASAVESVTYTGGATVKLRVRFAADRLQARAWLAAGTEPTTWTIDTIVDALPDGGTHFGMFSWLIAGNSNTLPNPVTVDNLVVSQPKYPRIEGYIADVRPKFRPVSDGTVHSVVEVDIGGVGSRLERKTADPQSPLRRSTEKFTFVPPVDYWPLEDKRASLSAASAFPDGQAMVATGPAVFAQDPGVPDDVVLSRLGSLPMCSLAPGAKLTAATSLPGAAGPWGAGITTDVFARDVPGVTEVRIFEWHTPSSLLNRWALVGTATGHQVRAYNDAAGTTTNVVTYANDYAAMITWEVLAVQNAGNIDVALYLNANLVASGSIAGTCTQPTRVSLNPDRVNTTAATTVYGLKFTVGHLTVKNVNQLALPFYFNSGGGYSAIRAWYKEPVHERLNRLTAVEEDIPFRLAASPDTTAWTRLNAQQEGGFVQLCEDAAEAESGGILYEAGFGYEWLPRSARYNQPARLVVDMNTYNRSGDTDPTEVLVPKLGLRAPNHITVERRNGSQAVAAQDQATRDRKGTVSDKKTLDLLYDGDTAQHASWRKHINTDGRGPNYPGMTIDLAANPGLIDDWLACNLGSRVQRTNQPTIAGLGTIDQVIDTITETIGSRQTSGGPRWTATIDTSPAEVWQPGVWGGPGLLWTSTRTVLSAGVNTTAVSWSINSNGDPWTTGAVSLRAQVGREEVLITNITGAGSSWTFTVTRSVNTVVTSHLSGASITLLDTGFWAL